MFTSPGSRAGRTVARVSIGSVTTLAPTYSTGTYQPVSLDTAGNLRVLTSNQTRTSTLTPTITSGTYGTNFIMGGLLSFTNAFGASGTGIIQSVSLNFKSIQTTSLLLFLFSSNPSSTTWTDNAAAAINAADVFKAHSYVVLSNAQSRLAATADTQYSATGLGIALNTGSTTVWGVLLTSVVLSATTGSTSGMQIALTTLSDN